MCYTELITISRFVKGKAGTVKDTKTGRTIVPRAEKGETQSSVIKKESSKSKKSSSKSKKSSSSRDTVKEVINKIQSEIINPQIEAKIAKEAAKKGKSSSSTAENIARSRVLTAIKENKRPELTPGKTPTQKAINEAITTSFSDIDPKIQKLRQQGANIQVKGQEIIATETSAPISQQKTITGTFEPQTRTERILGTPAGRIVAGFGAGLTFDKNQLKDLQTEKSTFTGRVVDLATVLGTATGIAGLGSIAGKGKAISSKTPKFVKEGIAIQVAGSGTRKAIEATAPKEQRLALSDPVFKDVFVETEKLKGSFIPVISATGQRREDFLGQFETRISQFVPKNDVERYVRAAEKKLVAQESVKLAELLAIERTSELAGRAAISKAAKSISTSPRQKRIALDVSKQILTKPPKGISYANFVTQQAASSTSNVVKRQALRETTNLNKFLQTAKIIAPIGAAEAVGGVISDTKNEGKLPSIKQTIGAAGFGALTAGVLGGAAFSLPKGRGIIGAPLASVPRRSTKLAGAILDPLEKPGDFLATATSPKAINFATELSGSMFKSKRAAVALPRARVFTPSISTSQFSPTVSNSNDLSVSSISKTKTNIFTPNISLPSVNTGSFIPSKNLIQNISTNINIPINISTPVNNLIPTSTNVPSLSTQVSTTSQTLSQSLNTNINVPSFAPSVSSSFSTNTNVPVLSPLRLQLPKGGVRQKSQKGYIVKVKSKGKFKPINTTPLPKKNAFSLGKFVTDNSSAAQFKIKKSDRKAGKPVNVPFTSNTKFTKQKKTKNTYVEKKSNRIDTPGEIQGITAKGLLKTRFKNIKL